MVGRNRIFLSLGAVNETRFSFSSVADGRHPLRSDPGNGLRFHRIGGRLSECVWCTSVYRNWNPSTIARMISAMIRTHSGSEWQHSNLCNWMNRQESFIRGIWLGALLSIWRIPMEGKYWLGTNEKNASSTWNVDTFVIAVNDLVPTVNWKDVVKELDHPGFMVRDRQALVLLVTALRRALPVRNNTSIYSTDDGTMPKDRYVINREFFWWRGMSSLLV